MLQRTHEQAGSLWRQDEAGLFAWPVNNGLRAEQYGQQESWVCRGVMANICGQTFNADSVNK